MDARSRDAKAGVPLKRASRASGSPRKQLWVERVAGSSERLKSGEVNSGTTDVGSMRDARPTLASGGSAARSRGADGAESMMAEAFSDTARRRSQPTDHHKFVALMYRIDATE